MAGFHLFGRPSAPHPKRGRINHPCAILLSGGLENPSHAAQLAHEPYSGRHHHRRSLQFYWAVAYMPLADLVTIYMAAPIFVTALAWAFLGEKIDAPRAIAVFIGFGGVVLAMRPSSASLSLPALVAIAGCLAFSVIMIITRYLRGTRGIVLVGWQAGGALIFGLVTAPTHWVPPTLTDFALLALLGVISTIAHIAVNRSLKLAPASVVMPYQYSQIIWAVLLGFLIFGDWPDMAILSGSGIIVVAGLFIFYREQAQAKNLSRSPS